MSDDIWNVEDESKDPCDVLEELESLELDLGEIEVEDLGWEPEEEQEVQPVEEQEPKRKVLTGVQRDAAKAGNTGRKFVQVCRERKNPYVSRSRSRW